MRKRVVRVALVLATPCYGQVGVVKSANQPIPGATVAATQGTTTVVTATDQNGRYSLSLPGRGVWAVEVTMVGFQAAKKGLTVSNAGQELDFTLKLKESPATARLSGSAGAGDGEPNGNQEESQIRNEGDTSAQQAPVADSEGALLISGTSSKGQSPKIQGTLSLAVENSALDAKPFSITGQDLSQPAYAHSWFTLTIGGPLVIPKLVKDPATFFFLDYFGIRNRNPYTAVETVPTEMERRGNGLQSQPQ